MNEREENISDVWQSGTPHNEAPLLSALLRAGRKSEHQMKTES